MQNIPIALSSDNSGFFMLATTLVSALANKKSESFYEVYVFCAGDVTEKSKAKLREVEKHFSGFSLTFISMAGRFENVPRTHHYVTTPSLYKMVFASHFLQYDKILYLDTDILVRGDLGELFLIDIKDAYLGGVPEFINYFQCYEKIEKTTGMKDLEFYINAGVLIMNLATIRRDDVERKWQELIGTMDGSVDQHILNTVCYGKTCFIPCKYNVKQAALPFYKNGSAHTFYTPQEIREAYEHPHVFHYTSREKPWNCRDLFLANEWYRYFQLSPFADTKLERKTFLAFTNPPLKWFHKIFYKEKLPGNRRAFYVGGIRVFSYKRLY